MASYRRYPASRAPKVRSGTSPASHVRDNPRLRSRVKSGHCQQGSQTVSADSGGFQKRLARTGWRAAIPLPAMEQCPRPWWSRPVRVDVRSMFARMRRYSPAAPGSRIPPRIRATARNGRSRQLPVSLGTSSGRIIELSSGLLIRGFGVQVPGGAPVMTRP